MRLTFIRSTGLGALVAEVGTVHEVDDARARVFIAGGRAVPAPGEPEPVTPTAITTESIRAEEPTPKRGRPRKESVNES